MTNSKTRKERLMAKRAGWENLSPGMRARYTRTLGQGDPKQAERLYNRGVSLSRARGHATGAARPAPRRPVSERARRIAGMRKRLARPLAELRAIVTFTENTLASGERKHHPGAAADLSEIRSHMRDLTDDQLEAVAALTPRQQRDWLASRETGPFDASVLYYHPSLGWSP